MKKIFYALCALLLVFACSVSVFAVQTEDEKVIWDEPVANVKSAGYVRFAERADGTLLMVYAGNGNMRFSNNKGKDWTRAEDKILIEVAPDATTFSYDYDGATHTVSPENLQPFVMNDGTVLVAYRARSTDASYNKTGKFYTSIRVISSTDGGVTFSKESEKILIEDCVSQDIDGFWEPFMIHLDDDTVALYYSDDLNVYNNDKDDFRQKIAYCLYERGTDGWKWTGPYTAIERDTDGTGLATRDGMPIVTKLKDGGFAMVVEAQDYSARNNPGVLWGSTKNCPFVVGLALSADGKTWSDPVPVIAPQSLTAGNRCSAPAIATLPDGRVVITWQTEEGHSGWVNEGDPENTACVLGAAISEAPLTMDTVLTPSDGGPSDGFRLLEGVFDNPENTYQIWNIVSCFGNDLYIAGGKVEVLNEAGTSTGNREINLRHATVFSSEEEAEAFAAADARSADDTLIMHTLTAKSGTATYQLPSECLDNNIVYRLKNGFLNKMDATTTEDGLVSFAAEGTEAYVFTDKELVSYGDVNGDGKLTVRDVLGALRLIVASDAETSLDLFAAEITGDAELDIHDVLKILYEVLN